MNYPQANVAHLFVMKAVAPKTSGTVETYADFAADGTMAVLNEVNTAVSDVSALKRFRLAQRSGTSILYSPWIERTTITDARTQNYSAPVQQISYIGYNGTSGSIVAINSNVYKVRIELDGSPLKQFGNKRMLKFGVYKSDSAATQQEVAQGLLDNLLANFKDETLAHLHFDMINSCATASDYPLDAGDDAAVVNGSTTITFTNHAQYNTGTAIAVGDCLRIAATATTGVALGDPVYRVMTVAADGLSVTVDRAVTSASGTYDNAHSDLTVIPVAAFGNFGIKISGQANDFEVGKWKYFVTTFTIDLQDAGATTVTYSTAAVQGIGYGAQVQEMQYLLQGNWGNKYRGDPYHSAFINDAVATSTYNYITFKYRMDSSEQLGYRVTSPAEIIIALYNDNTQDNAFLDILQGDTTYFPSGAGYCANFS